MLPVALAFLANPAFYAGTAKTVGSVLPFLGSSGSNGSSTPGQVVDVQQHVAQQQTVNIGSQSDIADQLAYILGQAPIVEYPQSTGGVTGQLDTLFNQALGVNTPTGASVGDSRYSATTAKASTTNINKILIYGGASVIAALLIFRKKKGS